MRLLLVSVFAVLVSGCSTAAAPQPIPEAASLPNLGAAPELTSDTWLNTEAPLRLAGLRGQVVLVEMWTFGCINCQRVIPHLQAWHEEYSGQGLVVIGNHFPEFDFERDLHALRKAVASRGITFPVAQDNDGETWRAYHNRYWPTIYLVDKQGRLRYEHIGEGAYDETEAAIQALLREPA